MREKNAFIRQVGRRRIIQEEENRVGEWRWTITMVKRDEDNNKSCRLGKEEEEEDDDNDYKMKQLNNNNNNNNNN